ncbi:uncharacterized protein PV07_12252 [Cladophialophora immunda]|uniref:Uncharacterized protein n=1 Tax=Cladophialophora immunda TaxID=569365 RepID=A0A0D2BVB0_9EURO|nr:uncharacterized protein PV07_12252 [Cladophialophora immunda]KIW22360.1 hypothetical protein PV07_12252 [Cladophialophora immunda]
MASPLLNPPAIDKKEKKRGGGNCKPNKIHIVCPTSACWKHRMSIVRPVRSVATRFKQRELRTTWRSSCIYTARTGRMRQARYGPCVVSGEAHSRRKQYSQSSPILM